MQREAEFFFFFPMDVEESGGGTAPTQWRACPVLRAGSLYRPLSARAFVMPWAMPPGAKLGKDKKRIKCLLFCCLDLGCE